MRRRDYRGHPKQVIDFWFPEPDLDLSRYDCSVYFFDPEAASRVFDFLKLYCTHVEGEWAGRPLVPEQWQFRMIRDLFGWKRIQDGTRKYRMAYVQIPRKNGKSTLAAGIALYLTFADHEPGAKVFSAATDTDQAGIIFETAKRMIESSAELRSRCEVFKRSIFVPRSGSVYRTLSGTPRKSGLNAHGIIYDELHEAPNRKLWDILQTSTAARRQPLSFIATTAGYDESTICFEIYELARKVRDGVVDIPTLLPVIYEATEADDWKSEKVWARVNPNFDVSVKPEFLRAECSKAQETPAYQNTFKRLHLNIWTRQNELWMTKDKWDACGEPLDLDALEGEACYGGMDLSSSQDLTALALVWPVEDDGTFHFFARVHFWLPKDDIRKKEDRDGVPYMLWARQGFITLTEGNLVDYDVIRKHIVRENERYNVKEIAYDRWNANQLVTQLQGDGFEMIPFGQGFGSMAGPTKQLMDTIIARTLHHGGNEVLNWQASNVSVRTDASGNWKPDKAASKKRIDGVVALIMALGRATINLDAGGSAYDEHGVLTI